MIRFISLSLLLLVAACDAPDTAEKNASAKYDNGQVARVAVAPDGTVLWAVSVWGQRVFFSSRGAQWSHSCGKGCTKTEHVPAATDEDQ